MERRATAVPDAGVSHGQQGWLTGALVPSSSASEAAGQLPSGDSQAQRTVGLDAVGAR